MTERRAIPVYLSLDEAAEAMSVSVKTIRRWICLLYTSPSPRD